MGAFDAIPTVRVEIEGIRRTILHAFHDYGDRFEKAVSAVVGEVLTPEAIEASVRDGVREALAAQVRSEAGEVVRRAVASADFIKAMVEREVSRTMRYAAEEAARNAQVPS